MASVYILTVNSVERELRLGSLSFQGVVNGRDVMSCSIISELGAYRPSLAQDVVITEDGTAIFGGLIRHTDEQGADKQEIDTIETRITCDSYNAFAERRFVTDTIPAGSTLKAALQILDDYLTDYGVTLDASQVTGPTLGDEWTIYGEELKSVLDKLTTITGYVWEIDPSKTFRMFEPGTEACPVNFVDGDGHNTGDIQVERSRDKYVNRVILRGGGNSIVDKTDTFTGNGTQTKFLLDYPLIYSPTVGYGYVTNGAVNYETLDLTGVSSGATWEYDPSDNSIERVVGGAPANGNAISITYPAQFPIFVTAEDASEIGLNGLYEAVFEYPDVYDRGVLEDLAASLLSQGMEIKVEVTFSTREVGVMPGQSTTITAADRNIDGTFLITEVSARTEATTDSILRKVKAIEGSVFRGSFRGLIKAWLSPGSSGGSISAPVTSTGGGVPAPPITSVQFNRSGVFGGDASFTYDEDTNSVVCGLSSSITATSPESCQAFGNDCHIADP